MAKKGKGFFGALGSALGSIPVVGKVKKAAKKKLKKAKKKLKKALKKAKKKLKKKLGKVLTKARKLKNNLSKSKLVKRFKKAVKKAVKKAKKYVKKVVKTVKKAVKTVVKAVKKAAKTTVKAVKKAAKTTVKAVKTAAKTTVKAVKTAAKATVQTVKTATKTAVQTVKTAAKTTVKAVKKAAVKVGGKVANAYNAFKDGGYKEVLSAGVDCIPILGNAKAAYETIVGKDPITGRKLEPWERAVSGASVFGGPVVKIAKRVGGIAVGGKQTGGAISGIIAGGKKGDTTPKPKDKTPGQNNVDDFNPSTATNKQKGNYGEMKSSDNLLNNQSLKDAGYDLKPIGRGAPSSVNDKIVKGIDGLYENTNSKSNIKYVIDEAKFGSSQLSKKPKDGPQMSDGWLTGAETGKSRILKAVDGDKKLADKIEIALEDGKVERVLSTIDSTGKVKTYRIDAKGDIIGEWP